MLLPTYPAPEPLSDAVLFGFDRLPITVAGQMVLMLLLGHAVLKERLNSLGRLAAALGVAGMLMLGLTMG